MITIEPDCLDFSGENKRASGDEPTRFFCAPFQCKLLLMADAAFGVIVVLSQAAQNRAIGGFIAKASNAH